MYTYNDKINIQYFITQHPEINKIVEGIKEMYLGAIVFVDPGNAIEIKVNHQDANVSDICDLVTKIRPDWDRERFLHGRYGYFVDYSSDIPTGESYVF